MTRCPGFFYGCSSRMEKTVYIVCLNDSESCNQLYKPTEVPQNKSCFNVIFGKKCGHELGYYKHMAFSRQKWIPTKHFILYLHPNG